MPQHSQGQRNEHRMEHITPQTTFIPTKLSEDIRGAGVSSLGFVVVANICCPDDLSGLEDLLEPLLGDSPQPSELCRRG